MTHSLRAIVAVGLIAALLGVVTVGAHGAANRSAEAPSGNPAGVALMAYVQKRYLTVPGVKLVVPRLRVTALLSLRSGIVVAVEFRLADRPSDVIVVARLGKPTYQHTRLRRCWQRVPRTSALGFQDTVGSRFPTGGLKSVGTPRRVPGGWAVAGTFRERGGTTQKSVLVINKPSYLLRSLIGQLVIGKRIQRLTERVSNLRSHPRMPTTRPVC